MGLIGSIRIIAGLILKLTDDVVELIAGKRILESRQIQAVISYEGLLNGQQPRGC